MRRARIQIKPNIAKAAKQAPPPPAPEEVAVPAPSESTEAPVEAPPTPQVLEASLPPEPLKDLHVDTSMKVNHVHFTDDVIDNEQTRIQKNADGSGLGHQNTDQMSSPSAQQGSPHQFATPNLPPSRMMTPRSRNVSMCEDESILQPKQPREKKRFSGKEELDTKTWKMSDLTRWNPKNDKTNLKRERRSSTSSTVITKSEIGDFDAPSPRINAPQVKIGADGRLVIDESSLVVQSAQINHESVWETVEEGRMGSKITSMSFRNRIFRKPNVWSERETDLFYEVLQCTGQDFGLMHHYLPQRSRPELKAKYNREEKINWNRLFKAISHPVRLDANLEVRIAKIMAEIEGEVEEKKAKKEYEKAEEKRVREKQRMEKLIERNEEKLKKLQAIELVKQARELEKGARVAAKLNMQAEKVAKQKVQLEQNAKDRADAKLMATEAKRIAKEARNILKETRRVEREQERERLRNGKIQNESQNLEREAERIIRRLMLESQRQERRSAQLINRRTSKPNTPKAPPSTAGTVDANASGGELGDTTSDSSEESSSATSSDDEAVARDTARREKQRMKEARRNLEPRKTVIEKRPVYVDLQNIKYAKQPIDPIVMALKANGGMFDSADEQDEVPELVESSAPSPVPGPAPPPGEVVEEDVVPQAVTDVVDEIIRSRSKTPSDQGPAEEEEESGESPRQATKVQGQSSLHFNLLEEGEEVPKAVADVVEELVRSRSKTPSGQRPVEEEETGEPPRKTAKVQDQCSLHFNLLEEGEEVPKAVADVVEDLARGRSRSKTPAVEDLEEAEDQNASSLLKEGEEVPLAVAEILDKMARGRSKTPMEPTSSEKAIEEPPTKIVKLQEKTNVVEIVEKDAVGEETVVEIVASKEVIVENELIVVESSNANVVAEPIVETVGIGNLEATTSNTNPPPTESIPAEPRKGRRTIKRPVRWNKAD